ncbi:retrovirus-related pol polyprotein from transposon TNT 1-94 [Tanacetum coccineum]|uniref:Retrovirus-related pol polyprotein from transposon TNT 1-94 n=1 Tax=Tanacetum coccineum TaxID=301880 RepID=A0ABQ5BS63_9ASTR
MTTETKSNMVDKMKPDDNSGIQDAKTKFDPSVIKNRVCDGSIDPIEKFTTTTTKSEAKGKSIVTSSKTKTTTVVKKREKKVYSLPGQKFDVPEEREPLRIFYESLFKQIPSSEMAEFPLSCEWKYEVVFYCILVVHADGTLCLFPYRSYLKTDSIPFSGKPVRPDLFVSLYYQYHHARGGGEYAEFVDQFLIASCYDPIIPCSDRTALDAPPVACRAYGGEPTLSLFRSMFTLGYARDWLTFQKRVGNSHPGLVTPFRHRPGTLSFPFPVEPFDVFLQSRLLRYPIEFRTFLEHDDSGRLPSILGVHPVSVVVVPAGAPLLVGSPDVVLLIFHGKMLRSSLPIWVLVLPLLMLGGVPSLVFVGRHIGFISPLASSEEGEDADPFFPGTTRLESCIHKHTPIIRQGNELIKFPNSKMEEYQFGNPSKILEYIKGKYANHQVNVQFLLQLQPEWKRFVTLVKQSQELKTVSYHKLYDILKQHQNEVNEIRTERLARTANPLALVAQQQPVYHHQNHPTQNTQYSSTRSQQSTRNRGKAIVTSSAPTYDPEPATVTEDEEMSKEKEIDKLMALISLSFKKIYKPTNNNLRTSSNTSRANQDNSPRINRGTGYDNQRAFNVAGARENVGTPVVQKSGIQCYNCKEYGHVSRECQKPKRVKDAAYHKEKMLLCKQEEAGVQLNAEQADWKDDTDDESDDQELEAHYMYMAQLQEVTPDPVDNSGPIFDDEPMHKKLKCEIDDSKNRNKFLESSKKELVDKWKGEIEDFKTKNKSLESSNNHFKEANNELSKTNQLMFKDLKKFQAELDKYNDVNYASKVEIDCAKAKGDLMSYKIDFEKSSNAYTQKINDLNQTISDMKKELCAHQETISIMSQAKEAQIKLYKTREDKELDKVIALENKVKVLNDIVYKTGQSVQTMNMLNRNCKTSFAKPEFLKKAQRANPRLYDIGCYNDNLALMLAPESDESIQLANKCRSKLSDLIRPFDYDQLNNLYDWFIPQREKSPDD